MKNNTPTEKIDIQALIDEVFKPLPRKRKKAHFCMYDKLDNKTRKFLTDLVAHSAREGRKPVVKTIVRILLRDFDIKVDVESLSKHLKRECNKCNERKETL